MAMKVKKGDTVLVIAGKDKGAKGKVIQAYPERDRVLVEGVNRIKKHTKVSTTQRGAKTGGIVTQEAAIHISNVMVVDGDNKPTKVGKRIEGTGERPQRPRSRVAPVRTSDDNRLKPPKVSPRLKTRYADEIKSALNEQFAYANVMQIPGVVKVVVNMGVGEAARDAKLIEGAVRDLALITGQKPEVKKARKSIAQFKLREGMPIGAKVTLRNDRMWEFLDRLVTIALPAYP